MNHHTIDLPLHLLQCRRNSKYLNNFMAFCVPEMRGKRKAKCSFASAQIQSALPAHGQPFTGTTCSWGGSFQLPLHS